MNPAQLLNPKAFAKEKAKAAKRTPNYGTSSVSFFILHWVFSSRCQFSLLSHASISSRDLCCL